MTNAINFVAKQPSESRQSTSKADNQGSEDRFDTALAKEMAPKSTTDSVADEQASETKPEQAAADTSEATVPPADASWLALLQGMQLPITLPKVKVDTQLDGGKVSTAVDAMPGTDKDAKLDTGFDFTQLLAGDARGAEAEEIAVLGKTLPDVVDKGTEQAGNFADDLNRHASQLAGQMAAQPKLLAQAGEGAQAARASSHVVQEAVGDSRWGDAVAQRVSLMLNKQEQQLEMQLNPPHLGPMEVKLTMAADQASVTFTSQHANVREALAAATPKLTTLLADQGITLANVQVASDSLNQQAQQQASQFQQQSEARENARHSQSGRHDGVVDRAVMPTTVVWNDMKMPVARGGLNLYV